MIFQTGFALHQESREKRYREKVIPPQGYILMEADAAGQEFRWMAECCGDDVMRSLCSPGEDPHSYMGSRINRAWEYQRLIAAVANDNEDALNLRKSGKVGNLSLQYRTSCKKFLSTARVDYEIDMTANEAQHIHRIYPITYKGVPKYWTTQIEIVKNVGYVETLAGRRVKVVGDWQGRYGWNMGSTAINYRIQGTGADQKYLALACLKDFMLSYGCVFAWDLHDGIYWYVPIKHKDVVARGMKRILNTLPYQTAWGMTPSIPMPWDVKVGYSWGSLKEWKEAA
jgi:DNA polymerase I-like protein with 3'-5' exonuclease and polymerase domains